MTTERADTGRHETQTQERDLAVCLDRGSQGNGTLTGQREDGSGSQRPLYGLNCI